MHPDTLIASKQRSSRYAWALIGALAMTGCATSRAAEEDVRDSPPPPSQPVSELPPDPFNPQTFAAQHSNPASCERQARRYLATSRDDAWAALKACVDGTHFTLLQALTSRAWTNELRTRPEGAALIAKVVALRGGSVEGDLRLLNEQRLPIFSLSAAMAQPDTYKGRYVLVRAQVGDVRTEDKKPTVWLVEQELGSVASEQQIGVASRKDTSSTIAGNLGGETTLGSGTVGGSLARSKSTREGNTVLRYDNISSDTGREALGRLPKVDPFLAPGRDFVILARFDGMRTTSGSLDEEDEGPRIPVLSIVSYYIPHPLVVY
jgi:PBP1b-binding outer membrane lipoprotein LpoB